MATFSGRRALLIAVVAMAAVVASVSAVEAADSAACGTSTCIANGESECDRETADCPPCLYLLSSGSFSCYDLVDGACPYDGTYEICDSSSSSSTSGSSATTTAPTATTTAPTTTTTAPTATTAAPSTIAPSSNSSSSDDSVAGTVTPIVKTTATTSGSSSALRSSSSSSSKASSPDSATPTPSNSVGASSSSSNNSGSMSSVSTSSSDNNSSDVVMIAVLVGAAAVGVVVVSVFVAHRVRRNRQAARDPFQSSFNGTSGVFAAPTAKSFGLRFAGRAYASHETPTTSNSITVLGGGSETLDGSIVMLADSQTRGVTQPSPAGITLLSMSSLSSSTADFSLGPQFRPDESAGGFVDLAASTSSLKTHPPASPMTLDASLTRRPVAGPTARAVRAQHVPQAIVEGQETEEEEDEFSSFEQQSRYVRLASAGSVLYCERERENDLESSGVSVSSSMSVESDEYDIVDPHTIREGERRNTELVVRDSEFPKFSAFSESDLLSEDGCDSDAGGDAAKEHEI